MASELFKFMAGISVAQIATYRPLSESEQTILREGLEADPFPPQEMRGIRPIPDGPFDEEVDDPDSSYYDRRYGERSQWLAIPRRLK
jgi:hypothetical protein